MSLGGKFWFVGCRTACWGLDLKAVDFLDGDAIALDALVDEGSGEKSKLINLERPALAVLYVLHFHEGFGYCLFECALESLLLGLFWHGLGALA